MTSNASLGPVAASADVSTHVSAEAARKATARARVTALVERFRARAADHLLPSYNETQARTEFITPLLEAFGWDVNNLAGRSLVLREVIQEASVDVEVGEERLSKRPDYELRIARQRKLFVEAKKPSVRIDQARDPAFQTRRYGYSGSLPVSILTNFHQLAVYDCVPAPREGDDPHVARIALYSYEDFASRFDELWDVLSRDAIVSGAFDRRFPVDGGRQGTQQFDALFLRQVRDWRARLAADVHEHAPHLNGAELTYAVQLLLSRIVFLRICEDRNIEEYQTLLNLGARGTFDEFVEVLRRADTFYNSGLFRLLDDERLGVRVSDAVLREVLEELYYPRSPYTFAVVEAEVLGEIYEQFLGEEVAITPDGVEVIEHPEVRASGGVVPTPRYVADAIVARTLAPLLHGRAPSQLDGLAVADVCCGSGIFLLSVFESLMDHFLSWYSAPERRQRYDGDVIFEGTGGQWYLTFAAKRDILTRHVFGVDIDGDAVEIAKLSLLVKLIEGETRESLEAFVRDSGDAALPSLDATLKVGNSLVSDGEWARVGLPMSGELAARVRPFTWADEFPAVMARGGFDAIVGNPPYIRIQNMTEYSPEEVTYYRDPAAPFTTARQDNFDKYALFVERSLMLLRPSGRLGVIVPHKFMTIHSGAPLRRLLSGSDRLEEVVHFGVKQVFGARTSNYTCILILAGHESGGTTIEHAGPLDAWRYGASGSRVAIPAGQLGEAAWMFGSDEIRELLDRTRVAHPTRLDDVAEIFVGVQTSADDVYIFEAVAESPTTVTLEWDGQRWPIERDLLRPCLLDVRLSAFTRPRPNRWMIFPYALTAGPRGAHASVIPPAVMARRYPGAWAYLSARRETLEERSITGGPVAERQWYQFGRSQSLTKFDSAKIILPILSTEPRYAYDDSNIVVTGGGNGPYYMVRPADGSPVSLYYLLAVLNHPIAEAFVRTNTSPFRGGYYSHGKQFIAPIPVAQPAAAQAEAIEGLVQELLEASEELVAARRPQDRVVLERRITSFRAQIEAAVSRVYGLSTADVALARDVPVPS